ncbi:cytochrome P450 3A29-like [Tubulanus polymorphus]|uniref:cytochrome P450 3A29-like n=1 Tax=Tubulanus polymorphus TaxID=672921 RepID=UPI003DA2233E
MLTLLLSISAICLNFYLYWLRRGKMMLFKDLGLPGPTPNTIFGNLIDIKKKGLGKCLQEWSQAYGKVYGYFEGPDAVLVTSDVDLLKRVYVKDFKHFSKRKLYPLAPDSDKDEFIHLFLAHGTRWKRLRRLLSPTYSSAKLKQLLPAIDSSIKRYLQYIDVESSHQTDGIDIYSHLQPMTLDIIGTTAFGIEISSSSQENKDFLYHCKKIFSRVNPREKRPLGFLLIFTFATLFPELNAIWKPINELYKKLNPKEGFQWILEKAGEMIEYRNSSKEQSNDFIQLMLNAVVDDSQIPDYLMEMRNDDQCTDINQNQEENSSTMAPTPVPIVRKSDKILTLSEMKANSGLFLLAGYESIAASTAYVLYELALNGNEQDIVNKEIEATIGAENIIDYQMVKQLRYLDMVIFETLRLHPGSVSAVARRSCADFVVDEKTIPSGTLVTADIHTIHRDIKHWGPEDTNLFIPERFSTERKAERHPIAFLGFGAGPRNCIGMRFALLEMKMILVRLLQQYRVEPCAKTEVPLPKVEQTATVPTNGVHVRLVKR